MVSHIVNKGCLLQFTKSEKGLSCCDDLKHYYKVRKQKVDVQGRILDSQ